MSTSLLKHAFTPEEIAALQEQLLAHKTTTGITWAAVAKAIDVNLSTLSLWATGKYTGDNQNIAAKVSKWFAAEEVQMTLLEDRPTAPGFQPTRTARSIYNMLAHARSGKLVIIIGDPGVGKTVALENFSNQTPNAWLVTGSPSCRSMNTLLKSVAGKVLGAIPSASNALALSHTIRDRVRHAKAVLIIDEAQNLDEPALEELRAIHDDTKVGLVLCGNRDVLRRVEGNRTAAFAQRFSRVSFRHLFETPHREDVDMLLDAWRITQPDERKYLAALALKKGNGGLRSMTQTLDIATMLSQAEPDEIRGLQHLQDAWAQLSHQPGIAA